MTGGAPVAHDLLVIGFGPAGAALALRMARRGFRVVVLEQHRVPRERLCGEFMSPDAMAGLGELGLLPALAAEAIPPPIERVRLTAARGPAIERPLMPGAAGLSRLALDRLLVAQCRAAGVTVVEHWRAVSVAPEMGAGEDGVVVRGLDAGGERRTLAGRVAVGASGKGAGWTPAGTASRFIAWKAHHRGEGPQGTVELHAFPGGYCGVAPIEGERWNVCGLATRSVFARAGATLPGLLAHAAESNAALAARLRALVPEPARPLAVASLDFARRRPVAEPMLQIGDAAAGIAPLAGDGIGMAIASAALAERWLAPRLAGAIEHREMLAGYAREWRRIFRRRLAVGAALQELFIAPRAAAGVLAVLGAFPGLADRLLRETRESVEDGWRLPTVS